MEGLKNSYERNGFLVVPEAGVNKDALKNISASLTSLITNSKKEFPYLNFSNYGDNSKLQRITQLHMIDEVIDVILNSKVGSIASEITNSKRIRIWGSQLYVKPKVHNFDANVGIHSEFSEMPFFNSGVLTAWIPFNDVSYENGTLNYLNSSHLSEIDFKCGAVEKNIKYQKESLLLESGFNYNETPVNLKVGGVSFHHNKLLHYSDVNFSSESRYALAVGLMTDNIVVDHDFNDFGYFNILNNLKYCPTIFSR